MAESAAEPAGPAGSGRESGAAGDPDVPGVSGQETRVVITLYNLAMWQQHIHLDPAILSGKPVVRGTRLAVEFVLGLLAQGWSEQQVLENYPGLTSADVRACLAYAQELLAIERAYPRSA
jgi:uncharacterized protein (DUF433 family)